jgi:hypothetical protein
MNETRYGRMADDSYGGFALAIHHKRSLKTGMFCNIIGLLEIAVCCYLTMIKGGATYRIIYDNLWIHRELTSKPEEQVLLQKPSCWQLSSS